MRRRTVRPAGLALGTLSLIDGQAMSYTFTVYPVRAVPCLARVVYAFSRLEGIAPLPLFLGAAEDLAATLACGDRRDRAIALGAVHLLVHAPHPADPVPWEAAAERLAVFHRPVLNPDLPEPGATATPSAAPAVPLTARRLPPGPEPERRLPREVPAMPAAGGPRGRAPS